MGKRAVAQDRQGRGPGLVGERTDSPEQVVEQIELALQCRGWGRCHIECHRGVRIMADALHATRIAKQPHGRLG